MAEQLTTEKKDKRFDDRIRTGRLGPHVIRNKHGATCSSIDALKLASEEYRICSARADELSRVVWQAFIGIVALAGAAGAGLLRVLPDSTQTTDAPTFQIVLSVIPYIITASLVLFLLSAWRLISSKWALQQKALYVRLNYLEYFLGYRTNEQFKRVDKESKDSSVKPILISDVRDNMAIALIFWWSTLASCAVFRCLNDGQSEKNLRLSLIVTFVVMFVLSGTSIGYVHWVVRRASRGSADQDKPWAPIQWENNAELDESNNLEFCSPKAQ